MASDPGITFPKRNINCCQLLQAVTFSSAKSSLSNKQLPPTERVLSAINAVNIRTKKHQKLKELGVNLHNHVLTYTVENDSKTKYPTILLLV